MYYTIYKITNQIDGKFYIGSHKTRDLNDKYMGSGKYLKKAIEKYGIENFTKEILFIFDTPELMYQKEAEIVNEDFLATENTYNLKIGGFGGWDWNNNRTDNPTHSEEHIRNMVNKRIQKYPEGLFKNKNHTDETKKNISKKIKGRKSPFYGKKHTDETKEKMRKSSFGKHKNELNSQYGTMWITDGKNNKKIKKQDDIPENWYKGRTMCV